MLAGIILNFVRVFWGLLSCLIPFLSIMRSTLGKISFDYSLKNDNGITLQVTDSIRVRTPVKNPFEASKTIIILCRFSAFAPDAANLYE